MLALMELNVPFASRSFIFFGFIWAALAVYSWDAWRLIKRSRQLLSEK